MFSYLIYNNLRISFYTIMIVTQSRPYEDIKAELDKEKTIGIVSCNTCVRFCQTGGRDVMEELSQKLKEDGFKVVDTDLIGAPCMFQELMANQLRAEITIVLACKSGFHNLHQAFPNKKLVEGLKTIGLGAIDKNGKVGVVAAL